VGPFRASHSQHRHPCRMSPVMARVTLFILLIIVACQLVAAQDKLLPVVHFQRLQGLPDENSMHRLIRDQKGILWISSANGLEKYDGYGCRVYRNIPDDPNSISSNVTSVVRFDSRNRLWVGSWETGLSVFDPSRERFVNFTPRRGDSSWLQAKSVYAILEDRRGTLWVGTSAGVVRIDIPTSVEPYGIDSLTRYIRFTSVPLGPRDIEVSDICERSDGKLLVSSLGGLFVLDPVTLSVSRPNFASAAGRRLDSLGIACMSQDADGTIWLGTFAEGLFRVFWRTATVLNYRHSEHDNLSIRSDQVSDIVRDREGTLWIATPEGLDRFSPELGRCDPYLAWGQTPQGQAIALSVDTTGTLWAGANAGGIFFVSPKSRRFPHYGVPEQNRWLTGYATVNLDREGNYWFMSWAGRLSRIDIANLTVLRTIDLFKGKSPDLTWPDRTISLIDAHGDFWHGTNGLGLYRVNLATGQIKNYRYASQFGNRPEVMSIAQGPGDTLWLSGGECGLMKFSPASGQFQSLGTVRTNTIMRSRDGKMWVTTEHDGVMVIDPVTGITDRFGNDPSDPRSLSGDRTRLTYEDAFGRIWICATSVINLWDPATRSFLRFSNPALKGTKHVFPLGADRKGRLWVRNIPHGLEILDPATGVFIDFDPSDGVCGEVRAMETLDNGIVLLAGTGINLVDPDSVQLRRPAPALLITKLSVNDKPTLAPALTGGIGSLLLDHSQNVIEFEFATIDIDAPHLVWYTYKLEGLEEEWVRPEDRRFVRYPGLRPGEYLFKVRAGSMRHEWPDQETSLAVSIAPPWWQTRWALAAYAGIVLGMLFVGYRLRLRGIQLKQQAEMDHFKAEHLAEVDRLKSRFFANISHEFRTPLTLISGPLEGMVAEEKEEKKRRSLSIMQRNSQRLLRLINQLLDLSKLEAGAMKLRAARMNIVPLVKGITNSFESSAGLRGISVEVINDREEIEVYCDREMVEKILTNLLSNAFKFTADGGSVTVTVTEFRYQNSDIRTQNSIPLRGIEGGEILELSVRDTGLGIPPDKLDKVFDRFYQVDASQTRTLEGSGIGLALVKELVELHHGTIRVESEMGKGTTFTVRLPLGRKHLRDDEVIDVPVSAELTLEEVPVADGDKNVEDRKDEPDFLKAKGEKSVVLVIEDNADVRAYIKDYLVSAYQVTQARDGEEGIAKALEIIPDLIISDVMMPKKDGYEVCKTLKCDEKTSHIPIIMLTAKAASENKIEGLQIGADDYLVKPFEPKELLARVKNLIELRRLLRERFRASDPLKPGEIAVTSTDDAFLLRAKAIVEMRMGDEKFSVEELATELFMSRSQLHRKLTALTNLSAGDFIRYLRLHRAMDLLKGGTGTISEIAYRVGFTDPSHFSRSFHRQFGITPSESLKVSEATRGSTNSA
jgi:signal transduction histidine kinase/DNA-binding response OmpR family regulator/ligand-binding sensor domain-containing protein